MSLTKNQVPLFDQLLHTFSDNSRFGKICQLYGPSKLHMFQAHRFVLDEKASGFLGSMLKDAAIDIMRQHEFARPPYEHTWIEFDYPAFLEAFGKESVWWSDLKLGFMISHNLVHICSVNATDPAMFMPYTIRLHHAINFQEELHEATKWGLSRLLYRKMLLGGPATMPHFHADWWMTEEAASICRSHSLVLNDDMTHGMNMGRLATESVGILKQLIAVLLLLVRPRRAEYIEERQVNARRVFFQHKQVALVAHKNLSIHLERRPMAIRYFATGKNLASDRESPKHHEVEGTWCQTRRKGEGCDHHWLCTEADEEGPIRYECVRGCGSKRWWRHEHERGDIRKGTVSKIYKVTR